MAKSIVLRGADIKLFLNDQLYPEVMALSYTIDYMENEIYGIDQVFPQEIATTKVSVSGSVDGIRTKYSGGLQGKSVRPLMLDIVNAPYINLKIVDRSTGEEILYIPNIKVGSESFQAQAKGIVKLGFKFKGLIPLNPFDRNS